MERCCCADTCSHRAGLPGFAAGVRRCGLWICKHTACLGFGGRRAVPDSQESDGSAFPQTSQLWFALPLLWLFSHPDLPSAWLGLWHFLTHPAASTGLPFGLRMLPPQPSQWPCLSPLNAEPFLTAFLQFLAQEKSLSQNIIGTLNEQTDVVWKSHSRQACMAGGVQPKHLSFSSQIACLLCMDSSTSH